MKQPPPPKKKSAGTKKVTSNIPSMMPPKMKIKRGTKTEPTRSEMTAIENRRMTPTNKGKKK